eukprot:IDg6413t1
MAGAMPFGVGAPNPALVQGGAFVLVHMALRRGIAAGAMMPYGMAAAQAVQGTPGASPVASGSASGHPSTPVSGNKREVNQYAHIERPQPGPGRDRLDGWHLIEQECADQFR